MLERPARQECPRLVDDIMVKSKHGDDLLADLAETFTNLRRSGGLT